MPNSTMTSATVAQKVEGVQGDEITPLPTARALGIDVVRAQ
jgi:hypothetical protein